MGYESKAIEEEFIIIDFIENLSNEISSELQIDKLKIDKIIFKYFKDRNYPIDIDKLPENNA